VAQRTETNTDLSLQLAPGTLLAGRYRLDVPIGLGGMGVVYRARDEELGIDIALKLLRPEVGRDPTRLERFRQELLLAREVSHPNVVRIHDIGEHDGLRFLTMRLVEGTSLQRLLEREGKLTVERAVTVFRQVAAGLKAAHDAGVVHRDLKPGNILIDKTGNATISDFGVARSLTGGGLTRTGAVVGTLDYLSPEQMSGEAVDGRSDLYALGIVFFEMLTGELPFHPGSTAEVVAQRLGGRPRELPPLEGPVPDAVKRVVRRCLERNPARRYADAQVMLDDLEGGGGWTRLRAPGWTWKAAAALAVVAGGALLATRAGFKPGAAPATSATSGTSARSGTPAPAAVPAAHHGVAILPLADETSDPELAWAGSGLAEMLASGLAEDASLRIVDSLRVLSALNDLRLQPGRYDEKSLRDVAGLWSADRLVYGSVRKAGTAVRVDLKLASVDPSGALSSELLSGEAVSPDGLFAVVKDLSQKLRARLGSTTALPAGSEEPETRSLPAARAYEDGRRRLLAGNDVEAAPALERAVAADPKFAAALESLAAVYANLGQDDKALDAADKALAAVGNSPTRLGYRVRARGALLKGSPAEGEKVYRELLDRFPHDAETRIDLALAQAAQGHNAEAVESLKKVVEVDPNDGRAWFLLGKSSILAGDPRRAATDYLVRALAAQGRAGNEKGRADVLNAIGVASQQLGDNARALESYTAALSARKTVGDKRGAASTLRNRALVYRGSGKTREAEADLNEARRLLQDVGDTRGLSDVLNDFGLLHEGRGEYDQALAAYQEALRVRRGLGDERLLAQSYDNVGFIYYLQGEFDHALVYWQQGLDLRRRGNDKGGLVLSLQNLGFLGLAQGKSDEARKSFTEALQLAREVGNKEGVAVTIGNLGVLHRLEGRYAAALDSLKEAVTISKQLDAKLLLTEFTLKEGEVLLELNAVDEAAQRAAAVETWVKETGNREHEADLLAFQAQIHAARGEKDAARAAVLKAAASAKASGSRLARLRTELAAASLDADDAQRAARLTAMLKDAESLGHAVLSRDAGEALARAELSRKRAADAERVARKALQGAERAGFTTWRLHGLLSEILAARGDAEGAARERGVAARLLTAVRESVPQAYRAGFDKQPYVLAAERRGG